MVLTERYNNSCYVLHSSPHRSRYELCIAIMISWTYFTIKLKVKVEVEHSHSQKWIQSWLLHTCTYMGLFGSLTRVAWWRLKMMIWQSRVCTCILFRQIYFVFSLLSTLHAHVSCNSIPLSLPSSHLAALGVSSIWGFSSSLLYLHLFYFFDVVIPVNINK